MRSIRFVIACRLIFLLAFLSVTSYSQDVWEHEYSIDDLPFEVEIRRLESVAKVLKSNSNKIVYLIGFNKNGTSKAVAWRRIRKSKNYLIKKNHISPYRIKLLYGGSQSGLVMRISLVEKGLNVSPKNSGVQRKNRVKEE